MKDEQGVFPQPMRIEEIAGFQIGSAQDRAAMTGVTVILCKDGAQGGVDISGGGPASRETPLLGNYAAHNPVHAVVLSGGSAFGLAAADGVMRYLEEHGIGYDTGFAKVPLVVQSSLFDLGMGSAALRPDADMGYSACADAQKNAPVSGSVGAGTGASVGKIYGMERASKSGLGVYALRLGALEMGAVVAVNALGDVFDFETGEKLAGLRNEDGSLGDSEAALYRLCVPTDLFTGNTTIGCLLTNAAFDRAQMNRLAAMARCGYARAINPVGTLADGDSIYALTTGIVQADLNVAGTLAARVLAAAIREAVRHCDDGLKG
ncbi:MAG: P1 family peptidase [Clostridia bacterium]|nr:P1 family peptidase [Clostridia bacterium]